jgi:hypothetical protein
MLSLIHLLYDTPLQRTTPYVNVKRIALRSGKRLQIEAENHDLNHV